MSTTVEYIRQKMKSYKRRRGVDKILKRDSLRFFIDANLHSRFFVDGDELGEMNAFPDGATFTGVVGEEDLSPTLTRSGFEFNGTDQMLMQGSGEYTALAAINDAMLAHDWTLHLVCDLLSEDAGTILMLSDGVDGYLKVEGNFDAPGVVRVEYSDASGQKNHFLVECGSSVRLALMFRYSNMDCVVNGVSMANQFLSAGTQPEFTELRLGCGLDIVPGEEEEPPTITDAEHIAVNVRVLAVFEEGLEGLDLDRVLAYAEQRFAPASEEAASEVDEG
jgi:hypothetical protein